MLFFKRVLTHADAEVLRNIRNACRSFMTRSNEYITAEQQTEWFKTAHVKYDLYIVYAIENGVIIVDIGFGVIHLESEQYFLTGGLTPDYRGKGLGLPLFQFLINNCKKQLPIRLEVKSGNLRAIKLYENLGFYCIGNKESDALLMEFKN
jgi:ribosomal protein S18 acetylase RimI-like enzyme